MEYKNLLEWLNSYSLNSWPFFPCNSDKTPATSGGFKDASTEVNKFPKGAQAVGLATGNGLIVLDIDPKNGGMESYKNLGFSHKKTYTVQTPSGGFHYYYYSKKELRSRIGIRPGIDVKANGGYVIAPPSPGYIFVEENEVEGCPEWLEALLEEKKEAFSGTGEEGSVVRGGRNNYLASLGGLLVAKGLSNEAIEAALIAENESRCEPPLPTDEVKQVAESILRYEKGDILKPEQPKFIKCSDLSDKLIESLNDKEKLKGEATLIKGLDKMLGGGIRLGELTALCATAKTGKSSFFHFLIHSLLNKELKVGYASREMSPAEEVLPNLLSVNFKENSWTSEISELRKEKYKEKLDTWQLYFSSGYGFFPAHEMKTWIEDLYKLGVRYFFVDHLHYCLEEPEDYKEAVKFTQFLKSLTKELEIAIWTIIQPTKTVSYNGEPVALGLNSLRGGAGIGQALDNLLILDRVKNEKNVSKLTLDVARSKLANPGHLYLKYNSLDTSFSEVIRS